MGTHPQLSFGALLRRYRQAAGLTQEELAERAHLSLAAINTLERGIRRAPRKETLALVAEALALTASERDMLETAVRQNGWPATSPPARDTFLPPGAGPSWPLVGRASERALLEHHLSGDGPPVLLLAGEPGIGKSRLLREASQRAVERGWQVLAGGCQRRSGQEPYAPLVGALERHIQRSSRALLRTDLDGCAWLVHLLPELAETISLSVPSWTLPPEQERRLMFAAVGRFLANVAGPVGTLLVLDDLQWAGTDALDLLTALVRSPASTPLRVLGAYRITEVHPPDPLGMTLADLATAGLATHQQLGPLAPSEASELILSMLAGEQDPGAERREQVLSRSGGVPFFLISCAEALRGGSLVSEDEAVPWTVAQSIGQRVAALPQTAQALLGIAAVIGRQMERGVLIAACAPTERDEGALVSALEDVGQARLLVEVGEDIYQFPHDLIREVIAAGLTAARRASVHRHVAEALEQIRGEQATERLAFHYARAGVAEKAIFYLERAGDRAWAMYAYTEAERHYRSALALAEELADQPHVAESLEKLGDVLEVSGRHEEARAAYERLQATVSEKERNSLWLAGLYTKLGNAFLSQRLLIEAEPAYEQAQAILGPQHADLPTEWWQVWLQLHLGLMRLRYWQTRAADMLTLGEQIRPVVERYGTEQQRIDWRKAVATATLLYSRYVISEQMLADLEETLLLAKQSNDLTAVADSHFGLGFARLWHGNLDEAETHLQAARQLAERTPIGRNGSLEVLCSTYLAVVHRRRGELEETRRYAEQALAEATAQTLLPYVGMARANLAWVAWRQGNYSEAEACCRDALDLWGQAQALYMFQWAGRWPMIAMDYANDRMDDAINCARPLVQPGQQALPPELDVLLVNAIDTWDAGFCDIAPMHLAEAIALAQRTGYL